MFAEFCGILVSQYTAELPLKLNMKTSYIVVGLGFGDETKGATVDALCRKYGIDMVCRFNGGSQAAHNVCTPDGGHHTFSQIGSGTFAGAKTFLSRFMLVDPSRFLVEDDVLIAKGISILDRVFVDERALVITPFHVLLNRVREQARGTTHHGTTGMGISETVMDGMARKDAIRCGLLREPISVITRALEVTQEALLPEMKRLGAALEFERLSIPNIAARYKRFHSRTRILTADEVTGLLQDAAGKTGIVFEGAQGILLDQNYGFHPHTTWSTTTSYNAFILLEESYVETDVEVVGVTRTYTTRHGAGPFPTEAPKLNLAELHNSDDGLAGQFRIGYLDMPLLRYAARCCGGIDRLAVSHLDNHPGWYCTRNDHLDLTKLPTNTFEQEALCRQAWQPIMGAYLDKVPNDFSSVIAEQLNVPLLIESWGPTYKDRAVTN